MAKAQKRGNKEAKKPKKIKEPVAAPNTLLKGISGSPGAPKSKKS
ncbi:hypothetical protein [Methylopila sp. M107]|nr:hypothetical protein [Methylopila sp. M107]